MGHFLVQVNNLQKFLQENRPLIMGVINVTPDSFSDGGRFDSTKKATEQVKRLIQEGVDILVEENLLDQEAALLDQMRNCHVLCLL